MNARTCTRCKRSKPRAEFYPRWQDAPPYARCIECTKAVQEEYRVGTRVPQPRSRAGVEATRRRSRRRTAAKYGLSLEEYDAILAKGCSICGAQGDGRRLHLDHDHSNGKIRACLCGQCNVGLGMFGDDPARLRAAARYLRAHRSGTVGP